LGYISQKVKAWKIYLVLFKNAMGSAYPKQTSKHIITQKPTIPNQAQIFPLSLKKMFISVGTNGKLIFLNTMIAPQV